MTDLAHTGDRGLRFHFEGAQTEGHVLPSAALVKALEQLQRIVHLLVLAQEGYEVRQKARVTRDIERRFPVLCHQPEDGGFALPLEIGNPKHQLFDLEQAETVGRRLRELMSAIASGNREYVASSLPDSYFRRGVLRAFQAMQPAPRTGLVLHLEDLDHHRLLDGVVAPKAVDALLSRELESGAPMPAFVTGNLIEMKFQERRLRLQLLKSNVGLEATYKDDFEPVLLENPRELIQVHGNVVYDQDGRPTSIADVDSVLSVDESELEIAAIEVDGNTIQLKQPLAFKVVFDQDDELHQASGPLGIFIAATSRAELEEAIDAELSLLWREYAKAPAEELSADALDLRQALLSLAKAAA